MKHMLEGITVLDFSTGTACAGAAAMMADYGALVIKIEAPGGDPLRRMPPLMEDVSLTHCWFNRGKKSVVLDLTDSAQAAAARKLVDKADVVLEDFMPGTMTRYGLDYERVAHDHPDLVYCSVTTFGQKGPYRDLPGNDLMAQALSGVMEITGEADGAPEKHGSALSDLAGAQSAYSSVIAALCSREADGMGQYIDVSTMRILVWLNSAIDRINVGVYTTREGNHHPALSPFGLFYGTKGQSVVICGINAKIWSSLCSIMGRPEFIDDPRYSTVSQRTAHRFEVVEIIESWLKQFDDIQQAIQQLEAGNVPACQVYSTREVLADSHYTDPQVGWLIQGPTPESLKKKGIATYLTHSTNAKFSRTPGCIRQAPDLGEHTIEILGGLA